MKYIILKYSLLFFILINCLFNYKNKYEKFFFPYPYSGGFINLNQQIIKGETILVIPSSVHIAKNFYDGSFLTRGAFYNIKRENGYVLDFSDLFLLTQNGELYFCLNRNFNKIQLGPQAKLPLPNYEAGIYLKNRILQFMLIYFLMVASFMACCLHYKTFLVSHWDKYILLLALALILFNLYFAYFEFNYLRALLSVLRI